MTLTLGILFFRINSQASPWIEWYDLTAGNIFHTDFSNETINGGVHNGETILDLIYSGDILGAGGHPDGSGSPVLFTDRGDGAWEALDMNSSNNNYLDSFSTTFINGPATGNSITDAMGYGIHPIIRTLLFGIMAKGQWNFITHILLAPDMAHRF